MEGIEEEGDFTEPDNKNYEIYVRFTLLLIYLITILPFAQNFALTHPHILIIFRQNRNGL